MSQPNLDCVHQLAPRRQSHHSVKSDTDTSVTSPNLSKTVVLGMLSSMFGPQQWQSTSQRMEVERHLADCSTPQSHSKQEELQTPAKESATPAVGIEMRLPKPPTLPTTADAQADEAVDDDVANLTRMLEAKASHAKGKEEPSTKRVRVRGKKGDARAKASAKIVKKSGGARKPASIVI